MMTAAPQGVANGPRKGFNPLLWFFSINLLILALLRTMGA
jgi:hypothetical protein